jgi:hypothetical protein
VENSHPSASLVGVGSFVGSLSLQTGTAVRSKTESGFEKRTPPTTPQVPAYRKRQRQQCKNQERSISFALFSVLGF